jgi:hypothetical protein
MALLCQYFQILKTGLVAVPMLARFIALPLQNLGGQSTWLPLSHRTRVNVPLTRKRPSDGER